MTHEEIKILISAYLDGEVTPSEKTIVQEHLSSCESCQKDYKKYQAMSSSLSKWSDETLSPDEEINVQKRFDPRRESMSIKRTAVIMGTILFLGIVVWSVPQINIQSTIVQTRAAVSPIMNLAFKNSVQGRLRSAADDIGDQYSDASTHVIRPQVSVLKSNPMPIAAGSFADNSFEPYYMASSNATARIPDVGMKRLGTGLAGIPLASEGLSRGGMQETRYSECCPGTTNEPILNSNNEYLNNPQPRWIAPISVEDTATNTEDYDHFDENAFLAVKDNPLSTFSIDVDTASYSNIRRFLMNGEMPPKDAVHLEEMINYFHYDYPQPSWGNPFSITTEIAPCPWNRNHQLALIGLQGKIISNENLPPSNIVLLVDLSGSMNDDNKLTLVKPALHLLVEQLRPQDTVSIDVFSSTASRYLEATSGADKGRIEAAIDSLQAAGSTNGEDGLQLAYEVAKENFKANGNNRIIVTTDGDFNVGTVNDGELLQMIEKKREEGTYLTILGFGMGNLKASRMEKLADAGNGNYAYIDSIDEARKVLVQQLGGTIDAIAKDVKIQVEFNPAQVKAYRLVGYEKRKLAKEDFNNDKKEAGALGSGHTVTALYEIVPTSSTENFNNVDDLKYQVPVTTTDTISDEVMTVKLRYKDPKSSDEKSKLIINTIKNNQFTAPGSENLRFAAAVAEFGMLLRASEHKGNTSYLKVINEAQLATGDDPQGQRAEFFDLVQRAGLLDHPKKPVQVQQYQPVYNTFRPEPIDAQDMTIINSQILNFNGFNDYVPTNFFGVFGNGARTITAWVKTNQLLPSSGNYADVISYGNNNGSCGSGFRLAVADNYGNWGPAMGKSGISIDLWCSAITYDAWIYDYNWHFIAVSIPDSSSLNQTQVYVDGQMLSRINVQYQPEMPINTSNENPISIGGSQGQNLFRGSIGEIRMYRHALTPSEITEVYYNSKGSYQVNLK